MTMGNQSFAVPWELIEKDIQFAAKIYAQNRSSSLWVDDCIQECRVKCWTLRSVIRTRTGFQSLIRNVFLDTLRQRSRYKRLEQQCYEPVQDSLIEQVDLKFVWEGFLERCTPTDKRILSALLQNNGSKKEAAKVLDCTYGTLRTYCARKVDKWEKLWREYYGQ